MPGSQKFLQDFHRKFLSNYSGISNVCLEMSRDSKICTYYNTAQLSTSYKEKQQELEMWHLMSLLCHGNVHAFRHGMTSAIRSESTFALHKCFSFKKVQNRRNRSIGYFDIDHNSLFWSVSFTVVLIRLGKFSENVAFVLVKAKTKIQVWRGGQIPREWMKIMTYWTENRSKSSFLAKQVSENPVSCMTLIYSRCWTSSQCNRCDSISSAKQRTFHSCDKLFRIVESYYHKACILYSVSFVYHLR